MHQLCEQISNHYDELSTNITLEKQKRSVGEIDILARKGNIFDVFEVKCSYRITKAKKQAKSIRKHTRFQIRDVYFYCGASGSLLLI